MVNILCLSATSSLDAGRSACNPSDGIGNDSKRGASHSVDLESNGKILLHGWPLNEFVLSLGGMSSQPDCSAAPAPGPSIVAPSS
jgi:hypothetical protein